MTERGRRFTQKMDVLDLIIDVLREHERDLSELISRMRNELKRR